MDYLARSIKKDFVHWPCSDSTCLIDVFGLGPKGTGMECHEFYSESKNIES
jgi:hypothetical protein